RKSRRDRDVSPDDELFVHDAGRVATRPWRTNPGRRRPVLDQGPGAAWSFLLDRRRSLACFLRQNGVARGVNHTMKSENGSATEGLKVGASSDVSYRMSCWKSGEEIPRLRRPSRCRGSRDGSTRSLSNPPSKGAMSTICQCAPQGFSRALFLP